MANQLEISVSYVNGAPLDTDITKSFLTSDIMVYEIDDVAFPGMNSVVQLYNTTANHAQYTIYYTTDTVAAILALANTNGTSMISCVVNSVNGNPYKTPIAYIFPANGVALTEVGSGTNVLFKNFTYSTTDSINTIVTDANVPSGGGGGTNPTDLYIPYNDAGTFADSYLVNDLPNQTIYTTGIGLGVDYLNIVAYLGTNTWQLRLDEPNNVLGFYDGGSYSGFKYDTSNTPFIEIGDSSIILKLDLDAENIKTTYAGDEIGISIDFATDSYKFGYINNVDPANSMYFEAGTSSIRTYINSDINGLYIENGYYNLGKVASGEFNLGLVNDGTDQFIKFLLNNSPDGIFVDFVNLYWYYGTSDMYLEKTGDIFTLIYNGNELIHVDAGSNEYWFGDYNSGYCIYITPASLAIYSQGSASINTAADLLMNTQSITLDDAGSGNLLQATSGSTAGQHLKVTIDGNPYVIELKNP
jgi:hypothetical protein